MFLTLNCSVSLWQQTAKFVLQLYTSITFLAFTFPTAAHILFIDIIFHLSPYANGRSPGSIEYIHPVQHYKNKSGRLSIPGHAKSFFPSLFKSYNL